MQDKSPSELFEEAAAYLHGCIVGNVEIRNVVRVRDEDLALSADAGMRCKAGSYYDVMPEPEFNAMYRSISNASSLWGQSEWLNAEALLWRLKRSCFREDECTNVRLLTDFVYSVIYWNPDLVESFG